ncbi:unnamed protein product [Arabidopsis thaliana]|uniref:YTH domain-containing protein n=1 Tax=Arabidopsis thaliana TaxID=3702 RepID=A0A654FK29_ARATH|nr:unnamed protein product [Arabidopsis thaliana]
MRDVGFDEKEVFDLAPTTTFVGLNIHSLPSSEHNIFLLLFCLPSPSILRFYLLRSESTDNFSKEFTRRIWFVSPAC